MRILIGLLFLLVSTAFAQDKVTPRQGPPPKNLTERADGRFSANSEPANIERFEVYVVKRGDTLSQIAGQVLNNSRLWPQLWEQNEHIVNPHWIYPNDSILIRPITQITDALPPGSELARTAPVLPYLAQLTPPSAPQAAQDFFILTPPKAFSEIKNSDLYCSGFVQVAAVPTDLKVVAKYDSSGGAFATQSDYIYLSQGSEDGLKTGDRFSVIRSTKSIQNPRRRSVERNLGTHYLDIGQVQVIMAQPDFSLARVTGSCEAVELGDIMVPFEQVTLPPLARPRQFNPFNTGTGIVGSVVVTQSVLLNFGSVFKGSGKIPGVQHGELASLEKGVASEGSIVYIDFDQSRVQPGDVLVISRPIELDSQLYSLPDESNKLDGQLTAIGELVVLKVRERAATALVTYSTTGISAGDSVGRK